MYLQQLGTRAKNGYRPYTIRPYLQHLRQNNITIIRQICNVKPEDVATDRSKRLLAQLEIDYLNVILREKASLVRYDKRFSDAIKFVTCR